MKLPARSNRTALIWRSLLFAPFLLLVLLAGCAIVNPTPTPISASSSNGLPIAQEFQSFYEENGGPRVFGLPLAEAYVDLDSGRLIQYFQRLRLEFDPSQDEVLVSPLGEWALPVAVAQAGLPAAGSGSQGPINDLKVQDAFLTFYQDYGGEHIFGPPISGQLDDGDKRFQYFQNGRLDWVPEAALGYRVQPGRLGEAHYRQVGIFEDPGRNRPMDSAGIREAEVSATLRAPILYAGEEQTVYVDVKTPGGQRPVAGVTIDLTAHYNGREVSYSMPETDGSGHSHDTLVLKDLEPGQKVRLVIVASSPSGKTIGLASKSFKSWW